MNILPITPSFSFLFFTLWVSKSALLNGNQHSFLASISQMSKLYTFIWNEMATSRQKIKEELHSGPFIFVPYATGSSLEDVLPGIFFSPEEVCWHDSTGSLDQMKEIPHHSLTEVTHHPLNKMLSGTYPGLRDFFIDGCGVHETPPLRSYLHILVQLSAFSLPSLAANAVSVQLCKLNFSFDNC